MHTHTLKILHITKPDILQFMLLKAEFSLNFRASLTLFRPGGGGGKAEGGTLTKRTMMTLKELKQ